MLVFAIYLLISINIYNIYIIYKSKYTYCILILLLFFGKSKESTSTYNKWIT